MSPLLTGIKPVDNIREKSGFLSRVMELITRTFTLKIFDNIIRKAIYDMINDDYK
jgi:hypothetical protein